MRGRLKLCLLGAALVAIALLADDMAFKCFAFLGASVCLIHGVCDMDPLITNQDPRPDKDV